MIATVVMLALTAVAAWTDFRRHRIYNWTTYPGIVAGFLCQAVDHGTAGLEDALWGFLACGGMMLLAFVFFPDLGGGDLKLIAMLGAGLGLQDGILAMLWTFVIGFAAGLAWLIWQEGLIQLFWRLIGTVQEVLVTRRRPVATPDADSPLNRWLFLGPAALAAVVIVRWPMWETVVFW